MSLSPHEEDVAAEIEARLRAEDTSWSRHVDRLSHELAGTAEPAASRVQRALLAAACLVGGLVLLAGSFHGWLRLQLALASGLPATSIRVALVVSACAAFAAAVLLVRAFPARRQWRSTAQAPVPSSR